MDQITGRVSGHVTMEGAPVFGAFVVAVDEYGIAVASAISLTDGAYRLQFLPKGRYSLYVEPLDGPMTPKMLPGASSIPLRWSRTSSPLSTTAA